MTYHVGGEIEVRDLAHRCAHEIGIQHTLHGEVTDLRISILSQDEERKG
jgi:hypothetical protein